MILVFPFSTLDQNLAFKNAVWFNELGGCKGHSVLVVHDKRCNPEIVEQIRIELTQAFDHIYRAEAPAEIDGWPQGANYFFRLAATWLQNKPEWPYFFWFEPDASFLRRGCLDALEAEYKRGTKPFMGSRVEVNDVPLHMSGIGVYPNPIYNFAGEAYRAHDVAWDVAAKDQIVPRAHFTKLIVHNWKHEAFRNIGELNNLWLNNPEMLVYHSDKSGSIIDLIRNENKNVPEMQSRTVTGSIPITVTPGSIPHMATMPDMPGQSQGGIAAENETTRGETEIGAANFGSKKAESSGRIGEDKETGEVRALRGNDEASRTSSGLQQRTGGNVAMPTVPSVGAQTDPKAIAARSLDGTREGNRFASQGRPEVAGAPTSPVIAAIWSDRLTTGLQNQILSASQHPITDIFIRTYPNDYPWLGYCLESINKFCTGFRKIWIVSPKANTSDEALRLHKTLNYQWKEMNEESPDGYLAQQITKLYADTITDYQADYILHVDSDVVFTRPTCPWDFLFNGKQTWYYTPYSAIETPWQPITEKFMGEPVENEFMRRFPIMVPRWLYPRLREFCHKKHGVIISEYVRSQPHRAFSEFNALGAYAFKHHRDKFYWVNTLENALPMPCARQFHSWGGITPEVKAEIEKIFEGGGERTLIGAPAPDCSEASDRNAVLVQRHDPSPSENIPEGIKELKSGIWVIAEDTHISKWVEQQERLDHDQNLLPFILPEINEGDTVVDAGAFIGDHTVAYLQAVGKTGTVAAFEPNPIAYQCLLHNVALTDYHGNNYGHGYNLQTYQVALGDRNINGLLLSGNNGNSGGAYLGEHMPLTDKVMMMPLDDTDIDPDFIKLDIEGCEVMALNGMRGIIRTCKPKLVIEVNVEALRRQGNYPGEIFSFLKEEGYDWKILQENCGRTDPMYDILAKPSKPLEVNTPSPEKENRGSALPTDPPVDPISPFSKYKTEGTIGEQIRFHVDGLWLLWGQKPKRKERIVKELRRVNLVPARFKSATKKKKK